MIPEDKQHGFMHFHLMNAILLAGACFIVWFLWQSWQEGRLQEKILEVVDAGKAVISDVINSRTYR